MSLSQDGKLDGLVLCEGDSTEWSIGINRATYERIQKEENPGDLVALWVFYAYTCRWQNVNQAYATSNFVMKALGWGDVRFQKAKKTLRDMGLIQDVRQTDQTGRVVGWYVKVFHLAKATPPIHSGGGDSQDVGNEVQMLKDSKYKCSRTITPNPKGGSDELFQLEQPQSAKQTKAKTWAPSEDQLQINSWFNRRDNTRWSDKELRVFRKLPEMSADDWNILDRYYGTPVAKDEYRPLRKDVFTLLNNWQGELDRARQWCRTKKSANGYAINL